jgi:hypothetical protein
MGKVLAMQLVLKTCHGQAQDSENGYPNLKKSASCRPFPMGLLHWAPLVNPSLEAGASLETSLYYKRQNVKWI